MKLIIGFIFIVFYAFDATQSLPRSSLKTDDRSVDRLLQKIAYKPTTSTSTTEVITNQKDTITTDNSNLKISCPNCEQLDDIEIERRLYIEHWKSDLLRKLGLNGIPKRPVESVNIPSPLYDEYVEQQSRHENRDAAQIEQTNEQVIILGARADRFCGKNCYHYHLTGKIISQYEIGSVQLWIHQLQKQVSSSRQPVIRLRRIDDQSIVQKHRADRRTVTRHRVKSTSGWVVIDTTSLLSSTSWKLTSDGKRGFYLKMDCIKGSCELSNEINNTPFIVIDVKKVIKIRRKRSIDCHAQVTECCRQKLYINFTDFGWNDWIIQPAGYDAFHCRGTCRASSLPTFGHTSIIHRHNDYIKKGNKGNYIKTCCSPRKFAPMSLLYYDNDGQILKKDVPDMTVEECGCS